MTALAAVVAYVLVVAGIVAGVAGDVADGVGLFGAGCLIALSTRLRK